VRHARETIARCWECETTTDRPVIVTLHAATRHVGRLSLCPSCYLACYLPLAPDASGVLDASAGAGGRRLR
jgi:hypothetical protein